MTFNTVLIANRGEIAVRVIRTVHAMGLQAVAIYSDADAAAPHVLAADKAVHIGPAAASESYLNIDKVIAAAHSAGAQAIHPGYGFLSENAEFAARCEKEGITFIGPPASAMEKMGDKITARATVESRDVPTVPGISRPGLSDDDIIAAAPDIGFPVLIKPSAGGGGKGMHRVEEIDKLPAALKSARREAASSFGDDTLFMEHFVDTPRHIEVQIVADSHGNVVHLGERECSLQRRHQKVIEEAPSALLDEKTRAEIGQAACDAARACGYLGAGTVEFIVSAKQPEKFFFMEMNTRLQVEHPVTELVTGVDLVEWQIRVARGEQIPLRQDQIRLNGHAVEARVYAEDAAAGFLPTGGTVGELSWPTGEGVRVDSGIRSGQIIGSDYDPMLAKVITYADHREAALARLDQALGRTVVEGVVTNLNFNRFLVTRPEVIAGDLDTGLLDRIVGDYADPTRPVAAFVRAVLAQVERRENHKVRGSSESSGSHHVAGGASTLSTVWTLGDGWRGNERRAPIRMLFTDETSDDGVIEVELVPADTSGADNAAGTDTSNTAGTGADNAAGTGAGHQVSTKVQNTADASAWTVTVGDNTHSVVVQDLIGAERARKISVDEGAFTTWTVPAPGYVTGPEGTFELTRITKATQLEAAAGAGSGSITSPMPGTVIAVEVESGSEVEEGQAVVVIEAMKMEHTLTAEIAGEVTVEVAVGDKVTTGQVLAGVEPKE